MDFTVLEKRGGGKIRQSGGGGCESNLRLPRAQPAKSWYSCWGTCTLTQEVGYNNGERSGMKTIATTEAEKPLGAIVDAAQREPIMIRQDDQDVAVVLSVADYERLRMGNVQAFLDLRNKVAAEAAANGLTEERLADLLTRNET